MLLLTQPGHISDGKRFLTAYREALMQHFNTAGFSDDVSRLAATPTCVSVRPEALCFKLANNLNIIQSDNDSVTVFHEKHHATLKLNGPMRWLVVEAEDRRLFACTAKVV